MQQVFADNSFGPTEAKLYGMLLFEGDNNNTWLS